MINSTATSTKTTSASNSLTSLGPIRLSVLIHSNTVSQVWKSPSSIMDSLVAKLERDISLPVISSKISSSSKVQVKESLVNNMILIGGIYPPSHLHYGFPYLHGKYQANQMQQNANPFDRENPDHATQQMAPKDIPRYQAQVFLERLHPIHQRTLAAVSLQDAQRKALQ